MNDETFEPETNDEIIETYVEETPKKAPKKQKKQEKKRYRFCGLKTGQLFDISPVPAYLNAFKPPLTKQRGNSFSDANNKLFADKRLENLFVEKI